MSTNDKGQLVPSFNENIDFILQGPGELKTTSAVAYQGGIVIKYLNHDSAGVITITANTNGLQPAILTTDVVVTDINDDNYLQNNKITNVTLYNNYPNPFNPSTNINFSIPNSGLVTLRVYNVLGQQVAELVNQEMEAGKHTYEFDGSKLSSGMYVYQLNTETVSISKKMLLIK